MSTSSMDPGEDARDSAPDFAALKARSARKFRWIIGIVAVVLAAAVGVGITIAERDSRRAAQAAAEELRGCLLTAPLQPGESPWQRFRSLQLRSMSRPDLERATKELWPSACRKPAAKAKEMLAADLTAEELTAFDELIKFLSDSTALARTSVDTLPPVLAALDNHVPGSVTLRGAPPPPRARDVDALANVPPVSQRGTALGHSNTEDNPGLALPVLITEEGLDAPLLCTFRGESDAAQCRGLTELKSVRGHGLRLLGTSDERSQTLLFAGRRGAEGVFVAGSATPIDRLYSYGGYASGDGTVSVLGYDAEARKMVLVQKTGEAAPVRVQLNPNFRVGNYFYSAQLLWDQVLVRGVTPDNERRLFTLPLSNRDASSFALVDIGELSEPGLIRAGEEEQPHLTGCRTRQATIIRVRGSDRDFITFRIDGKFSQPVEAPTWGVLGCHGTTATVVSSGFATSGTRLHHARCTSAGCEERVLKSTALDGDSGDLRPAEPDDVQAVDLDGKLLAVWLAGERGGLRMRMAAPDLFDRAEDVVLFDDRVGQGREASPGTLLGFRLYSREHFAVLLLSSMAGLHAFRIEPDASVKPFKVEVAD